MRQLLLGVNIDHVATLRQARDGIHPEPLLAANEAVAGGADSITVHLREDRRHIQDHDVLLLNEKLAVPLNLEMSIAEEIVVFAQKVAPPYVCMVPEKRQERTTESGLDVLANATRIGEICNTMRAVGSRVSLFIDPATQQIEAAAKVGAGAVELHTGDYANSCGAKQQQLLQQLQSAAQLADSLGLLVHAGHGLDFENVMSIAAIAQLSELNIGYSIVCRSVYCGIRNAVAQMQQQLQQARDK